jgi:tetratricopeptide (TPR) repeat protein
MEPRPAKRSRLILKLKDDKIFKTTVTLLLAGLTIVTSLIVIFNVQASSRGSAASRDSRILGIRYLTHLDRTQWEFAAEKDALDFYKELSGLMLQAGAYTMGPGARDVVYYNLARERLDKIRAVLAAEGELTRPPYFNPQLAGADLLQYYLDKIFIPAAEILERQEQKKAEGGFWGSKSDAYTAGLAVMAVAVFLLTLSLVLSGRIRFFMAGSGLLLIAAVISISAAAGTRYWSGPADESIREYARASGHATRAQIIFNVSGDSGATLAAAGEAEAEIDRILVRDPHYRSAIQVRSRLRMLKGETLFYGGKTQESRAELEKASADLATLLRTGPADGYLYWSQGYAEYLLGQREASLRSIGRALELLPDQGLALGTVKAAALLAGGKIDDERAALEAAIEFAVRKPLASDPIYFRTLIQNLERFQELTPVEGLPAAIRRLKEASVSLAVLKKSRPLDEQSEIAPPRFVAPVYDKRGEITDVPPRDQFPKATARAYFLLELKGMQRGQSIVRKVYRRLPGQPFWIEQLMLGRAEHWEGPAEARLLGDVENPIPEAGQVLASGDYRIEIYIEGRLKASGTFKILG